MVAEAPGSRVFISYRREDSGYPAGWLFDQLAALSALTGCLRTSIRSSQAMTLPR